MSPANSSSGNNNNNRSNSKNKNNSLFRDSINSASLLLEGVDPECVAWTQVSSSGCRLTMKDTAVSLTIPEGALAKSEEVFCAILTEERDRPKLHGMT